MVVPRCEISRDFMNQGLRTVMSGCRMTCGFTAEQCFFQAELFPVALVFFPGPGRCSGKDRILRLSIKDSNVQRRAKRIIRAIFNNSNDQNLVNNRL
jgi:hypothetical protein